MFRERMYLVMGYQPVIRDKLKDVLHLWESKYVNYDTMISELLSIIQDVKEVKRLLGR